MKIQENAYENSHFRPMKCSQVQLTCSLGIYVVANLEDFTLGVGHIHGPARWAPQVVSMDQVDLQGRLFEDHVLPTVCIK